MTDPHPSHSLERRRVLVTQLHAYLDGELPADLCAELEAHLAGCPDCRVVLDTLGQTVQILHALDAAPPPLPAELEARLLARLVLPNTPGPREPRS
jgi:RNA polymerase sigma-70 factor (ECF subfamily)